MRQKLPTNFEATFCVFIQPKSIEFCKATEARDPGASLRSTKIIFHGFAVFSFNSNDVYQYFYCYSDTV